MLAIDEFGRISKLNENNKFEIIDGIQNTKWSSLKEYATFISGPNLYITGGFFQESFLDEKKHLDIWVHYSDYQSSEEICKLI